MNWKIIMKDEITLKKHDQIHYLEEYFIRCDSPEEFLKKEPSLANRAITLLERIQELFGVEYVFAHLQESSLSSYSIPSPRSYCPSNPRITRLYGIYDIAYFKDFLRNKENEAARI